VPTAGQYDAAAIRFNRLGRRWEGELHGVGPALFEFASGPIRDELEHRITTARRELEGGVDHLRSVAALCDIRAEVCRRYSRDVLASVSGNRFLDFGFHVPQPPFPWVEL
jgi:hypothetical protein